MDYVYFNTALTPEERAADLVSRMTLEEKIAQMQNAAPAIPRLGMPAFDWWSEGLHGVARAGTATVFPQAISLAAAFDVPMMHEIASIVSDEARAKHHEFARRGDYGRYKGLAVWSPNINIFRDPRWGRGQETYGEDPYLTARLGVAFVQGLQGDHPTYLKTIATPKHFAAYSGPEPLRHGFDALVSAKDLRETYLPAFHAAVTEGGARSVMGAYNRLNGEPCCASPVLLQTILREEWGFDGYVVSDCGAICDIDAHHRVVGTRAEAAALAVKNGCDLNCGNAFAHLLAAVREGLIDEADIDRAVTRLMRARIELGMFDAAKEVPHTAIPYAMIDCDTHRHAALRAAHKSFVLLKNDGVLPLKHDIGTMAVIGPMAASHEVLTGNYAGTPSRPVTLLRGMQDKVSALTRVYYAQGCELKASSAHLRAEALAAAERADVIVLCLGLSPLIEGEEGEQPGHPSGDRQAIELPTAQQELLEAVTAVGKPVVLVLTGGSPIAAPWAHDNVAAVMLAWYPGGEGGTALADVLFGDRNPAGRLPVTFYKSTVDLPPFEDYRMDGRTYRYFEGEPLYPFGFGLSYTRFEYSGLHLSGRNLKLGAALTATARVTNHGERAGDEVVQAYLADEGAQAQGGPIRRLVGFARVELKPGQSQQVTFTIDEKLMSHIDDAGRRVLAPGQFELSIGGSQPDARSYALGAAACVRESFCVEGDMKFLPY